MPKVPTKGGAEGAADQRAVPKAPTKWEAPKVPTKDLGGAEGADHGSTTH